MLINVLLMDTTLMVALLINPWKLINLKKGRNDKGTLEKRYWSCLHVGLYAMSNIPFLEFNNKNQNTLRVQRTIALAQPLCPPTCHKCKNEFPGHYHLRRGGSSRTNQIFLHVTAPPVLTARLFTLNSTSL